ncbi:MAG: insulinase family protein, partial [Bacteroidales bacterium]|nr:insulinase family protein [Bacteroidales bacterium]
MPHDIIRLQNGLRLVHKELDAPISHFGVLVNAGTRDESDAQMGMAHFVEHTIFKGTTRRNAFRVISRMEVVGGDMNASTSKEETYFHTSF